MSELINNNVFDSNKKFVDLSSLDYFWDKAKSYIDGVDEGLTGQILADNPDAFKGVIYATGIGMTEPSILKLSFCNVKFGILFATIANI